MKKTAAVLLVLVMLLASLVSCGGASVDEQVINIVTTSHVVADWIANVVGNSEAFKIDLLADKGKDMHNFQPSATDVISIKRADIIIYIGGESDLWIEDAARDVDAKKLKLLDCVPHADHDVCEGDEHHHDGADEHIWLSFENAVACVSRISELLSSADVENSELYQSNSASYISEIEELSKAYRQAAASAKYKTLVFADRFPFVYLMEELGVDYLAAFPGCSAETTASFDTIVSLAAKVDEQELPCVLVISDSADGIAKTVVENTKSKSVEILTLDSMQVYKGEDSAAYIEVMRANLSVFEFAFGKEKRACRLFFIFSSLA